MHSSHSLGRLLKLCSLFLVIVLASCRSVYFEHPVPMAGEHLEDLPEFWGHAYEVLPVTEDAKQEMEQAPVYDKHYIMEFTASGAGTGEVYFSNYIRHGDIDKSHDIQISVDEAKIAFITPDTILSYTYQRIPTGYMYNREVFRTVDLPGGKLTDEEGGREAVVLKKAGRTYYINRNADEWWELDLFDVQPGGDILWYEVDEDHFEEHITTYRNEFSVTDLENKKFLIAPDDKQLQALIEGGRFFKASMRLQRMHVQ